MQQLSVLRVAQLYDGSAWALVDATHLQHLQVWCLCSVAKITVMPEVSYW